MFTQEEMLFMELNKDKDPYQIAMSAKQNPSIDIPKMASQIQAKQKLSQKLPTWTTKSRIYFPKSISQEQASSEITAEFKASIVSGNVLDLTGGMGVDTAAFAKRADKITYTEIQKELYDITHYNHDILGFNNIVHEFGDGMEFFKKTNRFFDFIYLDPARRSNRGV